MFFTACFSHITEVIPLFSDTMLLFDQDRCTVPDVCLVRRGSSAGRLLYQSAVNIHGGGVEVHRRCVSVQCCVDSVSAVTYTQPICDDGTEKAQSPLVVTRYQLVRRVIGFILMTVKYPRMTAGGVSSYNSWWYPSRTGTDAECRASKLESV